MKTRVKIALVGAVTISGLAIWWLAAGRFHSEIDVSDSPVTSNATIPSVAEVSNDDEDQTAAFPDDESGEEDDKEIEEVLSEEEKLANAIEEKVETFESLTDKWMNSTENGVSMKDIETFGEAFRNIPENRQIESAQRALNLIPDENVMLLTGLLLDKRVSREVQELIFSDILNRDDTVKMPILRQIHLDKSHPCWEDSNWILE